MTDPKPNIDTLFAAAIEIDASDDRDAYLERACGGDAVLKRQVDRLLRAHFRADDFLEAPAFEDARTVDIAITERPGTLIGPYKLLEEIGEGGFGVVYMAEQESPVRRRVALKVIKPGMDSRDVIARFDAERQALALMDHPNVARVLDAGATSSGRPFFVMDLIKGIPITEYADEAHLTTRERLDLFLEVCHGVQHAHLKGVIHRDLKPSNVLVTLHGSKPVPKVIDFGVAKAIHQRLTERTLYTRYAQMIGTPLYMSPEQAALSGLDVDTRSDVYSLGVLLYELLTGTTPLGHDMLAEASYDEIRQAIREVEPPTPSQRLATTEMESLRSIAACRRAEPRNVAELLRGDLDWITMKALEKDRTRRYETVSDLAQDIGRYLADEPVEARPPSRLYRARKFVRRNRTALALAACAALAIAAVIGSFGWLVGERAARLGETARLAEAALVDAESAMDARDWTGARVAALRVQGLVLSRGSDRRTEGHVEDLFRDLDMAARLEALQHDQPERNSRGSSAVDVSAPYETAFAEYGLELETLSVDEAARRIRERERIAAEITAGLEDWAALLKHFEADPEDQWRRLLSIAEAADPDRVRIRIRKLWAADDQEALAKLAAAARLEDLSRFSVRAIARALESTGALEDAVALLERAWELEPGDFWINDKLAHYLHKIERWDDALRFASSAVALRPTSPNAYVHLGIAFQGKDLADEAIAAFEQALRLEPRDGLANSARLRLGAMLSLKGLRDASIDQFREVLRRDPDSDAARFNMANTLAETGRFEESIAEFHALLQSDPNDAELHVGVGNALSGAGRLDDAIGAYREGIRLDPTYPGAHNNLGIALAERGRYEEAVAAFRESVRLAPDAVEGRRNLAMHLLQRGRLAEVATVFGDLLRRRPDDSEAFAQVAGALIGLGRFLAAARLCRTTFREHPEIAKVPSHAFSAAVASAAASAGLGEDADQLDADARASLRTEALRWLETCLELDHEISCEAWFGNPALAGIRDGAELAKLPEDEAARLGAFWAKVRRREIPIIERLVTRGELPGEPVRLREHRRAVLPDLVTFASIDAALEDARAVDLIPAGASWKYLRGRAEPSSGLEWTRAEFDDASWEAGTSGFGYGDGDDETTLTDMRGAYTSVYVRKEFEVDGLERYEAILLEVLVDDGYVAYLNGEEIGRANVGSDARPSVDALAFWGTNDPFFGPSIDVTDRILRGTNVLAIHGLNSSLASSDFSLLPVLRGIPKDRAPQAESFVAFRGLEKGEGGERRVTYLDGRLLELRGEYEAAISELEKAVGAEAEAPRLFARLVDCWTALGREGDAEARLRDALGTGAQGLGGLWIELRERRGLGLREILRDWPEGVTSPISLPRSIDDDSNRAVRVDLGQHVNVDVVADPGDSENDAFDGAHARLVVLRGGEQLLRGVPTDRRVGVHRLGPYSEKNAIQLSPGSREPLRIHVPRGRYAELRFLVSGGSCASKVSSISARVELADGRRRSVSIPCPDGSWLKDPRHALPANVVVAWGGMDRALAAIDADWGAPREYERVEVDGDLALYEVTLEITEDTELVALEIDPARAEYQSAETRFNIFAITALKRAEERGR